MSQYAKDEESPRKSRFIEVLTSVITAVFGVHSRKQTERDSKRETIVPYLATAVVALVVIVLILAETSIFIGGHSG